MEETNSPKNYTTLARNPENPTKQIKFTIEFNVWQLYQAFRHYVQLFVNDGAPNT